MLEAGHGLPPHLKRQRRQASTHAASTAWVTHATQIIVLALTISCCAPLQVHTVPTKSTGYCGSVMVRLIPAPRGAGIVAARTPKKVLQMAGIEDCYTCSRGSTKTLGNFVKATFFALAGTYGFLTPDLWRETVFTKSPLQVRLPCNAHVISGAGHKDVPVARRLRRARAGQLAQHTCVYWAASCVECARYLSEDPES